MSDLMSTSQPPSRRCANDSGRVIARTILPTESAPLLEFFRGMRGTIHVVLEESTQAQRLYDLLAPVVAQVIVCDPAWDLLQTVPYFGPVRIALILATMQTPRPRQRLCLVRRTIQRNPTSAATCWGLQLSSNAVLRSVVSPNVPAFSERQSDGEARATSSSAATPCWAARMLADPGAHSRRSR
jgi:hypothetical protein